VGKNSKELGDFRMEIEVYFKRLEGKLYRTRVNPRGGICMRLKTNMEKIRDENHFGMDISKEILKGFEPGGRGCFSHYIQEVEMEQGICHDFQGGSKMEIPRGDFGKDSNGIWENFGWESEWGLLRIRALRHKS
jgi:hypothetical protein